MFKFLRILILSILAITACGASFSQTDLSGLGALSTNQTDQSCTRPSKVIESVDPNRNDLFAGVLRRMIGGDTLNRLIGIASTIASGEVMSMAKSLGGILAVIGLMFAALFAVLEGESIAGAVMEVLIKAAVVGAILTNYDAIVIVGFKAFSGAFTALSGSDSPGSILAEFIKNVLLSLYTPFKAAFTAIGCSNVVTFKFSMLFEALVAMLFMIVGIWLLMVALLEAIFGLLAGPFILALAIAVGPLSIACSLNRLTASAFDKWLGFAISGAIMTGIAGIVLRLFSESMRFTSADGEVGLISVAIVNLVNVLIAGKLFGHIPDFANGLSPHGGSAFKGGAGGGRALGGAIAGVAGAVVGAGAGAAAVQAAGGAGAAGFASQMAGGASSGKAAGSAFMASAHALRGSAINGLKSAVLKSSKGKP